MESGTLTSQGGISSVFMISRGPGEPRVFYHDQVQEAADRYYPGPALPEGN